MISVVHASANGPNAFFADSDVNNKGCTEGLHAPPPLRPSLVLGDLQSPPSTSRKSPDVHHPHPHLNGAPTSSDPSGLNCSSVTGGLHTTLSPDSHLRVDRPIRSRPNRNSPQHHSCNSASSSHNELGKSSNLGGLTITPDKRLTLRPSSAERFSNDALCDQFEGDLLVSAYPEFSQRATPQRPPEKGSSSAQGSIPHRSQFPGLVLTVINEPPPPPPPPNLVSDALSVVEPSSSSGTSSSSAQQHQHRESSTANRELTAEKENRNSSSSSSSSNNNSIAGFFKKTLQSLFMTKQEGQQDPAIGTRGSPNERDAPKGKELTEKRCDPNDLLAAVTKMGEGDALSPPRRGGSPQYENSNNCSSLMMSAGRDTGAGGIQSGPLLPPQQQQQARSINRFPNSQSNNGMLYCYPRSTHSTTPSNIPHHRGTSPALVKLQQLNSYLVPQQQQSTAGGGQGTLSQQQQQMRASTSLNSSQMDFSTATLEETIERIQHRTASQLRLQQQQQGPGTNNNNFFLFESTTLSPQPMMGGSKLGTPTTAQPTSLNFPLWASVTEHPNSVVGEGAAGYYASPNGPGPSPPKPLLARQAKRAVSLPGAPLYDTYFTAVEKDSKGGGEAHANSTVAALLLLDPNHSTTARNGERISEDAIAAQQQQHQTEIIDFSLGSRPSCNDGLDKNFHHGGEHQSLFEVE